MKKLLSLVLVLLLCLILPQALAEEITHPFPAFGMEITLPENAEALGLFAAATDTVFNLTVQSEDGHTLLLLAERMDTSSYNLLFSDEATAAQMEAMGMRVLGQQDGYTYCAFFASDFENVADFYSFFGMNYNDFSADTKTRIQAALPAVKAAGETLTFIPIVQEEKKVEPFLTTDLDGNQVTEAIFENYDLTVINVWGTFCSPCIGEMPALAQWHATLPENVQLIGVISDVNVGGDTTTARSILDRTGVKFVNLLTSPSLYPLLSMSQYVPTTYFVDAQGNMVGQPIVGADVEGYKQFVAEYLHE